MTTTVHDNPTDHRYEVLVDGAVTGFSAYRLDGQRITFIHTQIDDAHADQGLGKQLVTGLLADVEERGLEVIPKCPYVRKVIAQDANRYLHLVPGDVREQFALAHLRD